MKLVEIVNVLRHSKKPINVPASLYHITLSRNVSSILQKGLSLGGGNATYQYDSPKIFCVTKLGENELERIGSIVLTAGLEAERVHDDDLSVIRINTTNIPNQWFQDDIMRLDTCVYTDKSIPASALSLFGKVDFVELTVVNR